jgi:hypothetical protein
MNAAVMLRANTVSDDMGARATGYPGARSPDAPDVRRPPARLEPRSEAAVDEALAASFPASDPPSWNPGTARPGLRR